MTDILANQNAFLRNFKELSKFWDQGGFPCLKPASQPATGWSLQGYFLFVCFWWREGSMWTYFYVFRTQFISLYALKKGFSTIHSILPTSPSLCFDDHFYPKDSQIMFWKWIFNYLLYIATWISCRHTNTTCPKPNSWWHSSRLLIILDPLFLLLALLTT